MSGLRAAEVEVVAEQHQVAGGQAVAGPAGGVGEHEGAAAAEDGGAHGEDDLVEGPALVGVHPARQHQDRLAFGGGGVQGAAVALDPGDGEAGEVGVGHGHRPRQGGGVVAESRAQDDRHRWVSRPVRCRTAAAAAVSSS